MKKSNYIFWMVSLTVLLISHLIYSSMHQHVNEGFSVGQFIDDFQNIAATIKRVTQAMMVQERKMMSEYKEKKSNYNTMKQKYDAMKK